MRMRLNAKRLTALLGAAAITASMMTSAFAYTLNVTRREQEKSKWCWVASAQMIGEKLTGTKKGQPGICKHVRGDYQNAGGDLENEKEALRFTTNRSVKGKEGDSSSAGYLKFATVKSQINDGRPLMMGIKWLNGGSHAVVIDGYKDTDYNLVHIVDPAEGSGKYYMRYYNLVRTAEFDYGSGNTQKGFWYRSIYTVKS